MYLDKSTFRRYREELSLFAPEDFHIGPINESRKAYVRICCGGSTDARLRGFAKMNFVLEDVYLVGEGFVASNSLIGYMEAQMIILFFEDANDYRKWLDDGVELDFLQYNDNSQKTFAVSCPEDIDLDKLSELIGAEVTTDLDWRKVKGTKIEPNRYIDSMVMVPSGTAPYQSEAIVVPKDARGMYFSGYLGGTDGCDVEGAVFYGCQKYVDGALNYAVAEGEIYSNIRKPLLVGQSLITQGLYEYVMGRNPSYFKGSSDLPVDKVSWFDLLHFCNKLSVLQGFRPCYYDILEGSEGSAEWDRSANGYRLLSEKEWEYIARANRAFEYSGGDDPNEVAWYEENSGRKRHPVGTKKENSFGTYDQSGNLYEWCWDLYDPEHARRVLRGGNWFSSASSVRAAYRYYNTPSYQNVSFGGRLARTPDLDVR